MRHRPLLFILAFLGPLFLSSQAQALVGEFYLGGSVGRATLENDFAPGDFDEDDTAFRGFLGHRLTLLPVFDLAVEAGYRDLGDPSTTVAGQDIDVSLTGYDIAALAIFPLGPVDLFLKAGGMGYTLDTSVAGLDRDFDGNAFLYGAGVGARVWKLGVRAEYELIDVDELDESSMYWVSVYYRF